MSLLAGILLEDNFPGYIMKTYPDSTTRVLTDRIYQRTALEGTDGDKSLMRGQMGIALFEAYYQQFTGCRDESRIYDRITACFDAIQEGDVISSFAAGSAGIAWGFLHLYNQKLLQEDDLDPNDIVEDLDELLFEFSMDALKAGDYDYLHGGLGACLYFLERRPTPIIEKLIEQLVEQLRLLAVRFPDGGITWRVQENRKRRRNGPDEYNFGLSHGTPSIVAILSLLYEKGYARTQCAELIQGNLKWMWASRNHTKNALFPLSITDVPEEQDSRLGWCYGDMGVACAFWLAGEKLSVPDWVATARKIILRTTQRRLEADTRIQDAGMCHGSAGVAYLFGRFSKRFHDPLLAEAAEYWWHVTHQYVQPEDQPATFIAYRRGQYMPCFTLLEGEAGIGMALLSELGMPVSWERLLLIS